MTATGKILIADQWQEGYGEVFHAVDPVTGKSLLPAFGSANVAQMDQALMAAEAAVAPLQALSLKQRADFLRCCAEQISAQQEPLLARYCLESGYPRNRAEAECERTCRQLFLFADYILTGQHLEIRIDRAQPNRPTQPDLRSMNQALGPVVVFGASNFPLAYSVAGGDTASALAAGCPVIVKGHPSHPGTCELVAQAIARAVQKCQMPAGIFSLISGPGQEVGEYLVTAPQTKAVGFTGSLAGGTALFKLANQRPDPIPVFAEMGSINPVFLLENTLRLNAETIAHQFVSSLTLGNGQYCVNPGLLIAEKSVALDRFLASVAALIEEKPAAVMLNHRICAAYGHSSSRLQAKHGVELVQQGAQTASEQGYFAHCQVFKTSAQIFLTSPELHEEVFGPSALVVECDDYPQLLEVAHQLRGQLTGSIHCADNEYERMTEVAAILRQRVGRLVINGFPTGVEVVPSMVHGGPFPATTDSRFSSVGTSAIKRFLRPVCWQNYPESLLPEALRDHNPLKLPRTIDGQYLST